MKYLKNLEESQNNIGCNEQEIEGVKKSINQNLPEAYLEFLILMGKKFGSIPRHIYCDLGWKNFNSARKSGFRMIKMSKKSLVLESTDIVFWLGENYHFAFFNILEGNNPPIYGFAKAQMENNFLKISKSFSEFMEAIKNNNPFIQIISNPILLRNLECGTELPLISEEELDRIIENKLIPENILKHINKYFSGSENRAAIMMAFDFAREKSSYSNGVWEGVKALITLADGNLKKMESKYLSYVLNSHFDPKILVDQVKLKFPLSHHTL